MAGWLAITEGVQSLTSFSLCLVTVLRGDEHGDLQRLGAEVDLNQLNSLVEDKDMLAENLQNWAQQERQEGEKLGLVKGEKLGLVKGEKLGIEKTARNLLKLGVLSDEQIAEATGLALDEVMKLRIEGKR